MEISRGATVMTTYGIRTNSQWTRNSMNQIMLFSTRALAQAEADALAAANPGNTYTVREYTR